MFAYDSLSSFERNIFGEQKVFPSGTYGNSSVDIILPLKVNVNRNYFLRKGVSDARTRAYN